MKTQQWKLSRKKKWKTVLKMFLLLLMLTLVFTRVQQFVTIADATDEIEQQLSQEVLNQLTDLDLSNLEVVLSEIGDSYNLFGNSSFGDRVKQIVNGEFFNSYDSIFAAIVALVFDQFISLLPFLLTIVAITVLSNIVSNLKSGSTSGGVNDMIHFVCYGVVVLITITTFTQIMAETLKALTVMSKLMEAAFPVLLTLLTAVGAVSSVSIYKPIVAILTGGVTVIFNSFLYPLFILSFIFVVISNLSNTMKLNKFNDFIGSAFKWVVGFVLTIFSSFLMVQGISAGKFDSVSIKATKFAVKSYVPIVGGFISEGFDFIILSSVLIKNAIGVGVLFLLFSVVMVPVLKIVLFKLGLQLTSAILEPLGNSRITNFTTSCAKILVYPIAILVCVAFMFLLTVALMMTTANIF